MKRELTIAAALLSLTTITSCSNRQDGHSAPSRSADENDIASIDENTLTPLNSDSTIADHVKRYEMGNGDPIEKTVYEKYDSVTKTRERYVLLDIPTDNPQTYTDNQDHTKASGNIQVFQQLDGSKTEIYHPETSQIETAQPDTLQGHANSHSAGGGRFFYSRTSDHVRYYPNYQSNVYSGSYKSGPLGNHGYYTDASDPIHNVTERQLAHQSLGKSGARSGGRNVFGKITSKGLQNISRAATRLSGFRGAGLSISRGVGSARMGGIRGKFGGSAFHAGG